MNSATCNHTTHFCGSKHSKRYGFSPIKRIRRWWRMRGSLNKLQLSETQNQQWLALARSLSELQQEFGNIRNKVIDDVVFNLGAPQGAQVVTTRLYQQTLQQIAVKLEGSALQLDALLVTLDRGQRDKLLEILQSSR